MSDYQAGILAPLPKQAVYLSFRCVLPFIAESDDVLEQLRESFSYIAEADGLSVVVGVGAPLVQRLGAQINRLKSFPAMDDCGVSIPSSQYDLWLWLRGDDAGELLHRSRYWEQVLSDNFELVNCIEAFVHDGGRDLTGYEDGTENPEGDEAMEAALVLDGREGLVGSSFVAVQLWQHDFDAFAELDEEQQDNIIGRHRESNEEFDEAPERAHVKRTAQESFAPEAFVMRRSMPWRQGLTGGLNFVAFGKSFEAFEAQLKRMIGAEDGIVDGLFDISAPVSGEYYWCPPVKDERIDLSLLGF